VLGHDREEVGEQCALDAREVLRDLGRDRATVIGPIDGTVARDGDGAVAVRRDAVRGRLRARLVLLSRGQAACRIVSLVRYRSPSSSL
jgi:hypothetical protein